MGKTGKKSVVFLLLLYLGCEKQRETYPNLPEKKFYFQQSSRIQQKLQLSAKELHGLLLDNEKSVSENEINHYYHLHYKKEKTVPEIVEYRRKEIRTRIAMGKILASAAIPVGESNNYNRFKLKNQPFVGKGGDLVVVEFTDYNCPYCRKMNKNIKSITNNFNLQWYKKSYPLSDAGDPEYQAHLYAKCVFILYPDKYENFSNELYQAKELDDDLYSGLFSSMNLDKTKLVNCRNSAVVTRAMQGDLQDAEYAGISGVPSVVIGNKVYKGYINPEKLKKIIENSVAR